MTWFARALAAVVLFGHGVWLLAVLFNVIVFLQFAIRGDAADEASMAFVASGGIDIGTLTAHLALSICAITLSAIVLFSNGRKIAFAKEPA